MTNPPNLLAIVKVDMLALMSVLFPIVSLVLAGLAALGFSPDRWGRGHTANPTFFLVAAGAFALLGMLLLGWRVVKIRRAFGGALIDGTITKVDAFRDRAYVSYTFELDGRTIEARHFVHQTSAVRALRAGARVRVAVDRTSRAAFVADLFA